MVLFKIKTILRKGNEHTFSRLCGRIIFMRILGIDPGVNTTGYGVLDFAHLGESLREWQARGN